MTNFERVKAMSVEEFALFLMTEYGGAKFCNLDCESVDAECQECVKAWLESEVQDETD